MKFDRYELFARICPAIIIGLPIFFFYHFFINPELSNLLHSTFNLELLSELPISLVILFCFYQVNRLLGKFLESFYFDGEKKSPTTKFLLYKNDEYSNCFKDSLRRKISEDFKIKLLNPQNEELNNLEARKIIIDANRLIRNKVKDGRLVLNRNIEYGFFRNLVGGSLIVLPFSAFGIYFFSKIYPSFFGAFVQIVSFIVFFLLIILSYPLLNFLGKNYANTLYQEYLGN